MLILVLNLEPYTTLNPTPYTTLNLEPYTTLNPTPYTLSPHPTKPYVFNLPIRGTNPSSGELTVPPGKPFFPNHHHLPSLTKSTIKQKAEGRRTNTNVRLPFIYCPDLKMKSGVSFEIP